jgi:hypothetical protein
MTEIFEFQQQVLKRIPSILFVSKSRPAGMLLISKLKMHRDQKTVLLNRVPTQNAHLAPRWSWAELSASTG